ncbi:Nuclear Hormone Receptor family [Caenorhabditis elegans]|uniref:Nuclear Hormone Receptor family n=1 Tax=Caenorhabditis elegans TaxID=6239 RepID=O01563_CAEEL|nr:Nuclear Hormone Receptor family [Caenorhabditis elegans]CCD64889.2 Nuclear Hormone Receptor family [Caenorhabditis elegans]|eukprot:NP_504065.2 Nuclear Hormone Receptor family [Caenorhabditis elegans]
MEDIDELPSLAMELSTSNAPKCTICGRDASCHNYGVLSCNACKMFFRRVVIEQLTYHCKKWNMCLENSGQPILQCKACRFEKCLQLGMTLGQLEKIQLPDLIHPDFKSDSLIKNVMFLNSTKRFKLCNFYTSEDPTLEDMVQRTKRSRMKRKTGKQVISVEEWSFQAIYIAVEMFLSLDFMNSIENDDKIVLLRNFSSKSMQLDSAMRSLNAKVDRVITPDGNEVYSDLLLAMFSIDFLNSIRSSLVVRVEELKVTEQEHALLNFLLFCNPAIHPLSERTRRLLATRQKSYSSALLQYCLLTYQQSGPSRFADLLSLSHVINKTSEDANSLTTLCQMYMPQVKLKKLLIDICINV